MSRRLITAALAVGALLACAPSASAADLLLDRECYLASQPGLPRGQAVGFTGTGFTPGAGVTVAVNGRVLAGTVTAGPAGTINASTGAPVVPARRFFATASLAASDGANGAIKPFRITKLAADFLPSAGNPRTLQVRFYVYGFGPLLVAMNKSPRQRVYEHIISPGGRVLANFPVGFTGGPCGSLATSRRRILPFRSVVNGRYRFVFDTRAAYSSRSIPQSSVSFIVRTIFVRRLAAGAFSASAASLFGEKG